MPEVLEITLLNPIHKNAHVVLHTIDGKEVLEVKKVDNNSQTVTFKNYHEPNVTFTVLYSDTVMVWQVFLNSYFNVPVGHYYFNGPKQNTSLGTAKVAIEYTDFNYSRFLLSVPYFGYYFYQGYNVKYIDIQQLNDNNRLTLFTSLVNVNELTGSYGWLDDQSFNIYDTNEYTVQVDKQLLVKEIQTSLPITGYKLFALRNYSENPDMAKSTSFFIDYDGGRYLGNPFSLFYASEFSKDYYRLIVYYNSESKNYSYTDTKKDLMSSLTIPSTEFSAVYENDIISDIDLNGNADFLVGSWISNHPVLNQNHYYWRVYAAGNAKTVSRPIIPDNLLSEYNFEYEDITYMYFALRDYNNINGFSDYLHKLSNSVKTGNALYYQQHYSFSKKFKGFKTFDKDIESYEEDFINE